MPDYSMFLEILTNLSHVGIGLLIFVLSYVSNMAFSLYYNIKMLGQTFDYNKLINSGLKLLSFCIGVACLTSVITALPLFADFVGFEIPVEYVDVFSSIVIIAVPLYSSCKYAVEAFTKMKNILAKEGIVIPEPTSKDESEVVNINEETVTETNVVDKIPTTSESY